MSGFVNPFAQIGDYRKNNVDGSASNELVTTAYLTGLPDPRQIANEHVGIVFKQMLKRDTRTKQRALAEFEQWLRGLTSSEDIEDTVHLAFIQMYAKLSLDISMQIRHQSQETLGLLYGLLGKKSSKYLKYSVAPWVVSQFDSDIRVATAARNSLDRIFPGEKKHLLISKFETEIREFIYDSCANATANTLSDERYYTKEETSQKYTHLVKRCLNALAEYPAFFNLETEQINHLVQTGRIWKFFSSSDSALARSAIKLASVHINDLEDYISVLWQELLRAGRKNSGGSGVALDVIQLMNVLAKRFPEDTWSSDAKVRHDAFASIGQFLLSDPPHPLKFWPLLYNLVLMVPEPPERDLTPLYKPLEKQVLKLRHNKELEESVWGCFVSLASNMGSSYVLRAFKAAEQRCKTPNVPVDSIAKFLARVVDNEGVDALVKSQLEKYGSGNVPVEYVLILTKLHKFGSLIEEHVLPRMEAQDLALLVDADNDLKLPENLEITESADWLTVATKSSQIDAQHVVECLVSFGLELDILKNARGLHSAGVKFSLDTFVLKHLSDFAVLEAAIAAHDALVSRDVASLALKTLVQLALDDRDQQNAVFRVIRSHQPFVFEAASMSPSLKGSLEMLSLDDRSGALKGLENLKLHDEPSTDPQRDNDVDIGIQFLKNLDLAKIDLSVPTEAAINELRALPPQTQKTIEQGTADCEALVQKLDAAVDDLEDARENEGNGTQDQRLLSLKIAVLRQFVKSWSHVALVNKFDRFVARTHPFAEHTSCEDLWELCASENYALAFHAALAFTDFKHIDLGVLQFERGLFIKGSLKAAVLAYHSIGKGNVQYDTLQRRLVTDALSLNLKSEEWMLVDRSHLTDVTSSRESSICATPENENDLLSSVLTILTLEARVVNLFQLVQESSDRLLEIAALLSLGSVGELDELVDFAVNLPQETGLDEASARKCLSLVNEFIVSHPGEIALSDAEAPSALIKRDDSVYLNWIGLRLAQHIPDSTVLDLVLDGNLSNSSRVIVSWLVALNITGVRHHFSERQLRNVFDWITEELQKLEIDFLVHSQTHGGLDITQLDDMPPAGLETLALNIIYNLSSAYPNTVREWYRDLRDRAFIKQVDSVLATFIVPAILRSINYSLAESDSQIKVNEKQREIRALREVEDEFTVEIIISLPEQYPGKPPVINIRNLAGVSEAKKRGWLLEARQNIQNGGVIVALKSILSRLDNFLEGIEPCAICYMTVNDNNKLPNKDCSQCHNIYHSDCLYKWFSTNGNKLCPMCRSPL